MPAYVPSKEEEFTELVDNLLLRLGAHVDGKNATINSLDLSDKDISAIMVILTMPYFRRRPLNAEELDALDELGVTDDIWQPINSFIDNNQDILENLREIWKVKFDIIYDQLHPMRPRVRGGKRRRVTRKHKVHRRKTRARRVRKVRKN